MGVRKYIEVKFSKEGVHRFPEAATNPEYATGGWDDVSFLAQPHFHYFHFVVQVEVTDSNREIEFIQFNRWCQRLYGNGTLELDFKSCEMIAEDLIEQIRKEYGERQIVVAVYEDNINGANIVYTPECPDRSKEYLEQVQKASAQGIHDGLSQHLDVLKNLVKHGVPLMRQEDLDEKYPPLDNRP